MRRLPVYLGIACALLLLGLVDLRASGASAPSAPLLTPTPSPTPTVEPERAILQYVVDHNPLWTCGAIGGAPGHRSVGCAVAAGHGATGTVDNYGDPPAAQATWQTRRANAQSTYPIFGDESYGSYPGYHAGNNNFPTAHYENYFWGEVWVMGAVGTDDTGLYRASAVITTAIFQAAQALGYLPSNPPPTEPSCACTPTLTPPATPAAPNSPTPTLTPDSCVYPCCEVFPQSSEAYCSAPDTYRYGFLYYTNGCEIWEQYTVYFQVAPSESGPWTTIDQWTTIHTFPEPVVGTFYEPDIPPAYAWYRVAVTTTTYGPLTPPTTPQPLCRPPTATGTPPTATATRTVTVTRTATATHTASASPSRTPAVVCDVFANGSNTTACDAAGHYIYDFPFITYCGYTLTSTVTLRSEVAPTSSGPWTLHDQQSYLAYFPPGPSHVQGTFVETAIPATNSWYRIVLEGVPAPTHGGTAGPALICNRPTETPATSPTPASSPTPCPIQYGDVPASNPFYPYVRCLACRGILSGYGDGTFRPYSQVTRGQAAKILANAAAYTEPISPTQQTFADVPPSQPFWLPIERAALHGLFGGYDCGGPGEPCDPQHRPYFRPAANLTRGQLAKIDATAAGYADVIPDGQQTFADVQGSQPFWRDVERVALHSMVNGYACGGPGEACDAQQRPYYRPYAPVTRGQTAKIVANTFHPACVTPRR